MPRLFIGMPVYNGARFISLAINSLRSQTFQDWKLLISDNCSTDQTGEICKKYASIDYRIYYHRHSENIGAANNFKFLLGTADSKFFMWAAADDEWESEFIEICIRNITRGNGSGMVFSNIVNTDSFGRVIREYPSLPFLSGQADVKTIYRYVKEPEILGKANLIYSVFHLEVCESAWKHSPLNSEWGSDMCFVLAAIAQKGIFIDRRVLFKKRVVRESDRVDSVSEIKIRNPQRHIFPLKESISYICRNYRAVHTTPYKLLVFLVMLSRLPIAISNDWSKLIKSFLGRLSSFY